MNLRPNFPEAYYQRAMLYLELGEADSALTDFEATVRYDGKHLDALLRIAAIHHESENYEKAEAAWRSVLNAEPDNKLARRRMDEVSIALAKQ
jgi:tetratricopeptide (TPR) repeat protein